MPTSSDVSRLCRYAANDRTSGPPAGRGAAQPGAPDLDAVLAGVAAAGDDPVVGVGHTGEHVVLADLPADRGGHAVAERRPGSVPSRRPACDRRWSRPISSSTRWCQSARRADEAGESADPVGEAAGAGVDESRRERIPRGVLRERRVGEAGPHPIDEPPVEFVEPVVHPRHAVVASVGPVDRRRRHVVFVVRDRPGRRSRRRRRRGRPQRCRAGGRPPMSDRRPRRRRSSHDVTWAGATASGTWPPIHSSNSARACLHGTLPARAGAPNADADVIDHGVVRLGAAPAERPPHRVVVRTEVGPAARRGDRSRRGQGRR